MRSVVNRYAGDCVICGEVVEAEAGLAFKGRGQRRWGVVHRGAHAAEVGIDAADRDRYIEISVPEMLQRQSKKAEAAAGRATRENSWALWKDAYAERERLQEMEAYARDD